jgi:hypothetical protein
MLTFHPFPGPPKAARRNDILGEINAYLGRLAIWRQERVGGGEPQRDTGADNERSVDQAGQQEHLGLQFVHQLGLACSCFEVLAAHDADADTGADGAQTDDQAGGQSDKS